LTSAQLSVEGRSHYGYIVGGVTPTLLYNNVIYAPSTTTMPVKLSRNLGDLNKSLQKGVTNVLGYVWL